MSKTYDRATATTLLELAFPGWTPPPYTVAADGVYLADEFRTAGLPETGFDWLPPYDMDWPGAPNPMSAPMLPIPFEAPELAAFMLDGAGTAILDALNCRIGDDLDPGRFQHPRMRMVKEVLQEALSLLKQAMDIAGHPNHDEIYAAHQLLSQCDEANGQANEREGVFAPGITSEESRTRRERAAASVVEQSNHADKRYSEAQENWKAWRKGMVRVLLGPERQELAPSQLPITAKDDVPKPTSKRPSRTIMLDQEKAIIDAIISLGHNPKSMPPNVNGKRGVRSDVREIVKDMKLFSEKTAYKKAWERLSENKDIGYANPPPPQKTIKRR